ncbi:MAG: NAD(P)-binding protein [Patescibacteria group bacterium]|nr:NAD(P)-binding protein [Patescibacteria group bacterium]
MLKRGPDSVPLHEIAGISPLSAHLESRRAQLTPTDFEYRICTQFLSLPKTIALLERGGKDSLYQQALEKQQKGARRLFAKAASTNFYRDLVLRAYHHTDSQQRLDMRTTMMTEILTVLQQQSRDLEQETTLRPKVTIIGAGGTGLTVARELLAQGMDPQDVLVVERRTYPGGQMAERNMMPFTLLKQGGMQGSDLLVSYQELAGTRFGSVSNIQYKNAVTLDAYFAGVRMLLGHEIIEDNGTSVVLSPDGTNRMVVRSIEDHIHEQELISSAAVFAVGQQAAYGTLSPDVIKALSEKARTHVYTASQFLEQLAGVHRLSQTRQHEAMREALKNLLGNRVALIGVLDSAFQITSNVAELLNKLSITDIQRFLAEYKATEQNPLITIYGGQISYKNIAARFLDYDFGHAIDLKRLIGYRNDIDRVTHLQGSEDTVDVHGREYGAVVFTGYTQDELLRLVHGISREGEHIIDPTTLQGKRVKAAFSDTGRLAGTSIFYAGNPFIAHTREPLIALDGKQAVKTAKLVVESLEMRSERRHR